MNSVCRGRSSVIIEKAKEEDVNVLCAGDLKKSFTKFPKHPKKENNEKINFKDGFCCRKS
jgi:hypothetical protein